MLHLGNSQVPLLGSAGRSEAITDHSSRVPDFGGGRLTPLMLLTLQAEGKLPGPAPRPVLQNQLREITSHRRPHFRFHGDTASVGIWASNPTYGFLIGQNKRGIKTIATIDAQANGCYYPQAVKIDRARNIWTGCEFNAQYNGGAVQEYSRAGNLVNTYSWTLCPPSSGDCNTDAYGYDGAANASEVFAAVAQYQLQICTPSCVTSYGSGFEHWPANSPFVTPTFISLPYGSPVLSVYYMDLDSLGNIWFDYYGQSGSDYGFGLAEITSPTSSSWQFVSRLPIGSIACPGGVYVSNGGNKLNVTDACARTISQYALPWAPSEEPTAVLGPTLLNIAGYGEPIAGGFNRGDTSIVQGDGYGWLDIGTVSSNAWKSVSSFNFAGEVEGAAYTPSDK